MQTAWFHTNFVPVVSKRLREIGVEPKAVLSLYNCSAHPNEDDLVSSDGKIRAKCLPPNVTSLIQSMDHGVLENQLSAGTNEILYKQIYAKVAIMELILITIYCMCRRPDSFENYHYRCAKIRKEPVGIISFVPVVLLYDLCTFGCICIYLQYSQQRSLEFPHENKRVWLVRLYICASLGPASTCKV